MPFSSSAGGPFGVRDIRSLYPGVTENHLRYLEKWGLVRPRAAPRDAREYSFADLTTIKHVAGELERGTPLRVAAARAARPSGMVSSRSTSMPAADTPRAKVVTLQARRPKTPQIGAAVPLPASGRLQLGFPFTDPQAALAAKYFIEASRLDDGDERNMEEAAAAYRKALVIDPDLVPAIVNLANIHYARDELIEAQALYERAIGLEPDCFEAHFNLGNIHHDLGRFESSAGLLPRRGRAQPGLRRRALLPGGHAREDGAVAEAKPHWRAYQELAPKGEWVELAKEFSGVESAAGRRSSDPADSIAVVDPLALLRRAAQLVERALRAPRLGLEAFLPGKRQHVAMGAELARPRASPPAARLELLDGGRSPRRRSAAGWRRRVGGPARRSAVRACGTAPGVNGFEVVH